MDSIMEPMEGATPLDPDEMEGLRFKHIVNRRQLDELEQKNIEEGLLWLGRIRRRGFDPLSEAFARELHRQLFGQVWHWAGSFRRTEKNIGVDPIQISVLLRDSLENARCWVEYQTYPPLEAAARLHHRLVYIHLFPNGNGRHARILADCYLEHYFGLPAIDWAAGQWLQNNSPRRLEYIAALRAADAGDFSPLLRFVGVDVPQA
ncbi:MULTISPECIES: mobile mystery protein B [unclassified Microbulbifer]|uniref:mobile mystery protein B n=1 Tax=unclassified Microbulbifer TaxID=2619833 RepID=UPI0027E5798E|nr:MULTISPECIES: mobile mystery protein B [unclassified Microbulbifer]